MAATARAQLVLVLGLMAAATAVRAEPIAIVVAADWTEAVEVSLPELRAVYLGRQSQLFTQNVKPIDLASGSPARAGFSRSVLGRSESALERYWIEQALMGGGLPPRQLGEDRAVLEAVRSQRGAIGYVAWSSIGDGVDGVRVLGIVSRGTALAPADAGYAIHLDE